MTELLASLAASLGDTLNIDFASPSWDLFIVIFFTAAVVLYGLTLGRERIIVVLVSIYVGMALSYSLPVFAETFLKETELGNGSTLRLAVFFVAMITMFLLFSRTGVFSGFGAGGHVVALLFVSILQVGLLVSTVLDLLPAGTQESLSGTMQAIFLSLPGRTAWIVLPLVSVGFLRGKEI